MTGIIIRIIALEAHKERMRYPHRKGSVDSGERRTRNIKNSPKRYSY